tara:strand:- start:15147 stop:16475 length:1329 start_codon:yes stop_codon:yes gene_type:complete
MHMKKIAPMMIVALAGSCSLASAQDYSNTLGDPGLSGSYVSKFLAYDDGTGESLYATGSFSAPGTGSGSHLARWDGSAWTGVGPGLTGGYSNTMAEYNGDLILGGYFDSAGGVADTNKLARWDGTEWHSMGAQMSSFLNSVWDLTTHDDGSGEALIVAGNYANVAGDGTIQHISKWDGSTYTAMGTPIGGAVPLIVLDVLSTDDMGSNQLFACGRFLSVDGVDANNIASWDGTSWTALGDGIQRNAGFAQGFRMATFDDGNGMALYVAGSFNIINGSQSVNNIAKWDGKTWSDVGGGFNSAVRHLTVWNDTLYAMGNFDSSNGVNVGQIAKWDGTQWVSAGSEVDDNVYDAIAYDTGEGSSLIFGGTFENSVAGTSNGVVALLDTPACLADLTGDGQLDFFDVSDFLDAFAAQEPAADFTGDGLYDFFDVSDFLDAFGAGCP